MDGRDEARDLAAPTISATGVARRASESTGREHPARPSAVSSEAADGYVELAGAGEAVNGEYHCADCGYGVVVFGLLPECPMCRSAVWEPCASGGRLPARVVPLV